MRTDPISHFKNKHGWKQKVFTEMVRYFMNVIYLALFFGAFTTYRRLILGHHQISYFHYGISFIEALILAKVIMIGDIIKLGNRFKDKPLIIPTAYKTIVFTIFICLFTFIESTVRGLLNGKGISHGIVSLLTEEKNEFFARNIVIFCALVPFFAFNELGRIVGENKIIQLFFRRLPSPKPAAEPLMAESD